jgi:hypothetical protein
MVDVWTPSRAATCDFRNSVVDEELSSDRGFVRGTRGIRHLVMKRTPQGHVVRAGARKSRRFCPRRRIGEPRPQHLRKIKSKTSSPRKSFFRRMQRHFPASHSGKCNVNFQSKLHSENEDLGFSHKINPVDRRKLRLSVINKEIGCAGKDLLPADSALSMGCVKPRSRMPSGYLHRDGSE